jgi:SAM-dependent methyltransferase
MTAIPYVGQELDVFARATNWKKYWSSEICSYLTGDVLEVGAGIGANTEVLQNKRAASWTCLEPDPALAHRMRSRFQTNADLAVCKIIVGTIETIDMNQQFDAILYIDVLEHIAGDHAELARASSILRPGGRMIVLAPAHPWLFTPFDRAIGHVRRYDKATLAACTPSDCHLERLIYLDSVGLLASLGNRLFLHQAEPGLNQILFWDRFLVPFSRFVDRITFHGIGKSILAIWKKT